MSQRIYMDHHATTPVDPRVLEAMLPWFGDRFGNPASRQHAWGWEAEEAVEEARAEVARLVGAQPRELTFTSGATEANNLALKGAWARRGQRGCHIVSMTIEHPSVLQVLRHLERQGAEVTLVPVGPSGIVRVEDVEKALRDDTLLVSVMAANSEIGTLQPLEALGRLAKERGILFHTDAAQAAGKLPLDVERLGADLLSFTAHKMYGPKGIGALYVRRRKPRIELEPQIHGGGHERGLRSGTLPVPLVVGFGRAAAIALSEMQEESGRVLALRQRLHQHLSQALDEIHLNGDPDQRLPGNLNLSFAYVEGQSLQMELRNIAVSSSSACQSTNSEPSHVLMAMGLGRDLAHAALRFGLGRFTTREEVDAVAAAVVDAVQRLRALSPLYRPSAGPAET